MRDMKIGLLFGSFNPPHYGHIALGDMVKDLVDEVWYIPAYQNPGKKEKAVDIDFRIQMLQSVGLKVSDIEREMGEYPHYTYDVMKELQKKYPEHHFSVICGEDINPGRWRNGGKLIKEFGVIKTARIPGLSSTILKEKLRNGESLEEICPPEIEKIIRDNNLYSL